MTNADGDAAKALITPFLNGGDLVRGGKSRYVLDLYGREPEEIRTQAPAVYQHLLETVKVERDRNKDKSFRENWWLFGRQRPEIRAFKDGIQRFIGTTETSKHRLFQFLDASVTPDHMIVAIGSDDPLHLAVLSSRLHVIWAVRSGGWLGIGNDSRYSKSRCFDPFPSPIPYLRR